MIFYNQADSNSYLLKQCISKRNFLNELLEMQKQKRKTLLVCMDKISTAIDQVVDVDNVSILFELLENLKVSLNLSEFNISKINKIESYLADLQSSISNTKISSNKISANSTDDLQDDLSLSINKFNEKYCSIEKKVIENTNSINSFLHSFIEKSNFDIPNSTNLKDNNSLGNNEVTEMF